MGHPTTQTENGQMTEHMYSQQDGGAVESVVIALHKVIELLERIKSAIEESSNKIPHASVQLSTVTEATEMATVEILDVLDTMSQKFTSMGEQVTSLKGAPSPDHSLLGQLEENIAQVQQDTMNIAMALQVQDITAQNIAAANHLIETVREELLTELSYFQRSENNSVVTELMRRAVPQIAAVQNAFDKNASFRKDPSRQELIDKVVRDWNAQDGTDGQ